MDRLARSPSVQPVLVHAASGAAFALANLILARQLPEAQYAWFTLLLAFMNLGAPLAAAGLDGVAVRGHLRFGPAVLGRVLGASLLVSLVLGAVAATYETGLEGAALVVFTGVAGGSSVVTAAEFQRRHRFGLSLALLQGPNLALLLAAVVAVALGTTSARLPLLISAAGFVIVGWAGWALLLREPAASAAPGPIPWGEAISLAGSSGSATLLGQLDRLLVPLLLPLPELATYGAISAVAGSLFRVLQRGVGYALLPRLRAAQSVIERRRLLAMEARVVGVVVLVGSAAIWVAIPIVEHWVLQDKYRFSVALVLAVLLVGLAKILAAVARAAATALADRRELSRLNFWGWVAIAVAVVAATVGARWGLSGVVYGVGLGWVLRCVATILIVLRHLRPAGPTEA
jgi:hypothetical protein